MTEECLIVVASYADGYLDNLLKSIKKYTTDVDYKIQVVDNNPNEENLLKHVIPVCLNHKVDLHLDKKITGFSDALLNGVEINKSKSKYILYLHTDIEVTEGWLREMIDCYKRHRKEGCRLVGCIVQDFNNQWQSDMKVLGNLQDVVDNDSLTKTEYVIGCYLRERTTLNMFNWDNNFERAYYDDKDICTQVRFWKYQCWTAGKALIYHHRNASHKNMKAQGYNPSHIAARNRIYYEKKWKLVVDMLEKTSVNTIREIVLGKLIDAYDTPDTLVFVKQKRV